MGMMVAACNCESECLVLSLCPQPHCVSRLAWGGGQAWPGLAWPGLA
jgi:hypothetical protein